MLVGTLSRLQCTLRCHQFPGGVLHLLTQIKHSISFVLQVELALPFSCVCTRATRRKDMSTMLEKKAQWEFYQSALANPLAI